MRDIAKNVLLPALLGALPLVSAAAEENRFEAVVADTIPEFDCVIEPSEIVDVGSAVAGVLESIHAHRSDPVRKGTVIAQLESSVERATVVLSKARAELTTSIELRQENAAFGHRSLRRNQALFHKSSISKQDLDKLKTESRVAELQVRQERDNKRIAELEYQRAQASLQRRTIRSPVDGIVMERFKSVGEYVEDDPILRVAQLDPLHVEVIVPVDYLGRITTGMRARVEVAVPGHGTHEARVTRVDQVADAASATFGVRLSLANRDYAIPSGLRCRLGFLPGVDNDTAGKMGNEVVEEFHRERIETSESVRPTESTVGAAAPEAAVAVSANRSEACHAADPVGNEGSGQQLQLTRVGQTPEVPLMTGNEGAETRHTRNSIATEISPEQPEKNVSNDVLETPVTSSATRSGRCFTIGPVQTEALARRLSGRLEDPSNTVNLRTESTLLAQDYLVLAAAEPNEQATRELVVRLDNAGVTDRFLLRRGNHRGRVSLGIYAGPQLAHKRKEMLAAKGFAAEVVPRGKQTRQYWLDVSVATGNDTPGLFEKTIAWFVPSATVEPVACSQRVARR